MPTGEKFLANLPEDKESLKAILRSLLQERDSVEKRAEELQRKAEAQAKRADELYLETLRLQMELARLKKGDLRAAGGSFERGPASPDAAGVRRSV